MCTGSCIQVQPMVQPLAQVDRLWIEPHSLPSGTVLYYFDKWNEDGTMLEIHDTLRRKVREQQGRNPEPTAIVIDSQTVKTTEAGGERGFDGGKQVKSRKRHFTVDTQGNLPVVHLHAANIRHRDAAEPMLAET